MLLFGVFLPSCATSLAFLASPVLPCFLVNHLDNTVDEHGDEPMTSAQADRLRALCDAKGETFDSTLTRDAAAARISELADEDEGVTPARS